MINDSEDGVQKFSGYLRRAGVVTFLTGAGMSTESGIPDFRSNQGLYNSGINEEIFDINVFDRMPERFYRFAADFLGTIRAARPHAGHLAITRLRERFGKTVRVCTQNIDSLHQDAGNSDVMPVHGTLMSSHCRRCGGEFPTDLVWAAIQARAVPRHPACGGVIKPDVVFFGEQLPETVFAAAERAMAEADLVVVAGTSLSVYPAAGLPAMRRPDSRLVLINRTPTALDGEADLVFRSPVSEVLTAAVDGLTVG